jgi:hypothetical protein
VFEIIQSIDSIDCNCLKFSLGSVYKY